MNNIALLSEKETNDSSLEHYTSFGVSFSVYTADAMLRTRIATALPHQTYRTEAAQGEAGPVFALEAPDAEGNYRCLREGEVLGQTDSADAVLELLGRELILHVAEHAPDHVFVHAGVVGWKGSALVLPGTSFAGKTTLTGALIRAGATYYSDEYAAVDRLGRVHPYARDLQVREVGGSLQRATPVAHFLGEAGTVSLPVAQVVFARYVQGAVWQPEPLSAGLAVLEMLQHSIPVQRTPARVMAWLSAMLQHAEVWQGERGEAEETSALLLGALDRQLGA